MIMNLVKFFMCVTHLYFILKNIMRDFKYFAEIQILVPTPSAQIISLIYL